MMGMPVCGMPAMAWPAATPMIPNPSPQPPLSAIINAAIADIIAKPKVTPSPHVALSRSCMGCLGMLDGGRAGRGHFPALPYVCSGLKN